MTTLLSDAGLAPSGKQIKDALGRNAVLVNDRACGNDDIMNAASVFAADQGRYDRYFLVKVGKKKHHLFYR